MAHKKIMLKNNADL